jgi:hypothetical protein
MSQNACYRCDENLGNQQTHFGGCIPDPYFYEDDIFNREVLAANTLLAIKNERCLHETFETALTSGHFVATKLPFSYFSWVNNTKVINELRDDWGIYVNGGDWIFTTYHVPYDIAEAGSKSFNWDYFYKVPEKYVHLLEKAEGQSIRYGLPKGEEFIKPIKRQYYGHPALFDLKNNRPYTGLTQSSKKMKKKLYELNQLRMLNIENSGFDFKSYKLDINLHKFEFY